MTNTTTPPRRGFWAAVKEAVVGDARERCPRCPPELPDVLGQFAQFRPAPVWYSETRYVPVDKRARNRANARRRWAAYQR